LLGNGLGPLATGILSDGLRARLGEESLRYALLVLSLGFLWAAFHLGRASMSVTHDLAATQVVEESRDSKDHPAVGAASTIGL
jgi:hypothetical protein